MHVQDLVHRYRVGLYSLGARRRRLGRRLDRLDLVNSATGNREHNDERHLALGACDLEIEALVLMAENLDVAAFKAAPAHRAVVEPSPVADELDDAHRGPILRREAWVTAALRCIGSHAVRLRRSALFRQAAPSDRLRSRPAPGPRLRART